MNTVQHADTSLIRQLECFRYLDDDVATLRRYFFRYEYPAGSYVFRERAHGGYIFFIADGGTEVIKQYDNARTTITTLGRGHSIGEMSLIDGRSRSATVRAKTNLTLVVLTREHFQELLVSHPSTANNILMGIAQLLSGSLRRTTHEFTEKMLSLC